MIGLPELFILAIIAIAGLFLAWFFVKRARFKEKITLLEKGIDINDLNLKGNNNSHSLWLRIGIIITGTAIGSIFVAVANFNPEYKSDIQEPVILLFTGISVIIAYFVGNKKAPK